MQCYEFLMCPQSISVLKSESHLNPPPTSLSIPSLWVIPVHQPQSHGLLPAKDKCFLVLAVFDLREGMKVK